MNWLEVSLTVDGELAEAVAEVLARVQGNRVAASRWLGLARATVRKLIARHLPGEAAGTETED